MGLLTFTTVRVPLSERAWAEANERWKTGFRQGARAAKPDGRLRLVGSDGSTLEEID